MNFLVLTIISLLFLFLPGQALAVCPVCTIAVAASVGLSRWLGIDDTISGLWIGGLILSSGLWLASWLQKKNIRLPLLKIFSVLLFYLFVIPPLYFTNTMGHPLNKYWGIDKLLLGIIAGSLLFIVGVVLNKYLRLLNNGKVYIYFQKVIAPVLLLLLGSILFYFLTKH